MPVEFHVRVFTPTVSVNAPETAPSIVAVRLVVVPAGVAVVVLSVSVPEPLVIETAAVTPVGTLPPSVTV
ncbi:hypothetical protein AGMMS49982_21960 [Bacteroidia bacterium]|nr:hypothetical protein AGMMS49982_21960 [Bacteroidia bacterium]